MIMRDFLFCVVAIVVVCFFLERQEARTRELIESIASRQEAALSKLEALARYPIARDSTLLSEDKDLKRSLAELLAKTGLANKGAE